MFVVNRDHPSSPAAGSGDLRHEEQSNAVRRTTVYLTERDHAALHRAARLTGRTRSSLIREGVRHVVFSLPIHSPLYDGTQPPSWYSQEEGVVISLTNAGLSDEEIARELRITGEGVRALKLSIGARSAAISRWVDRPRRPGDAAANVIPP
jgi:DNA-binding CsgD family transcriptional regulator